VDSVHCSRHLRPGTERSFVLMPARSRVLDDEEADPLRHPRRGVPRSPGYEAVRSLPADPGPDCALSGGPRPQVPNK